MISIIALLIICIAFVLLAAGASVYCPAAYAPWYGPGYVFYDYGDDHS